MTSKLTKGLVKTTSEIPHWLNILILHTKVQKFLYFSTIGKKQFGGKSEIPRLVLTQANFSDFHDFHIPGMQISNSMTFRVNPVYTVHVPGALNSSHSHCLARPLL